jgi:3-oxoacyl-[acyl-carrier protein] reductase
MEQKSNKILAGKNAVVTGCLKGIGRATLDMFAQSGANVWACCQYEDAESVSHFQELAGRFHVEILPVYFDLSEAESIKTAVRTIAAPKKQINILVNVAGMTQDALFHMVTMEQMKKVAEINFFSQMLFTQYITKLMLRSKNGSVVNIASITGMDGNPGQLSYSAAKAALIAATKTLSAELAPHGIRVNAVAPGVVKTGMTEIMPDEIMRRLLDKSCLKRIGTPDEIAGVITFLASDMSSYITGQIVRVDGGIGIG